MPAPTARVMIGPLEEQHLPEATRIFRVAFGTFLGVPEPEQFWSDRDYVTGRWRAPNVSAFAATRDGSLVGSNFATRWGSVGFFGPITVLPDLQDQGTAQALLARTMAEFDHWGTTQNGLFTFAQSARHVGLYRKFGFYPRFLTAIMAAPARNTVMPGGIALFSALPGPARDEAVAGCRVVTDSIYPGFDISGEIHAVQAQGLGDTVLLEGPGGITGFAVCHHGPQSEAGADTCFIKTGAVRGGPTAAGEFARLIDAVEAYACSVGMGNVLAGANLARREAYEALADRGFRTMMQGVYMHQRNEPGYCREGAWVIDDWR